MAKRVIKQSTPEDIAAYRVKRLQSQADMMHRMITPPEDVKMDALFRNYAAVLTVSALVGYSAHCPPVPIGKNKNEPLGEPVQRQFFLADQLRIIDLIAFAHLHEPLIIRSTEKFDIFSGYAAAGFKIMCEMLKAEERDWTKAETVLECGKLLAKWYLTGSKCFSVTSELLEP